MNFEILLVITAPRHLLAVYCVRVLSGFRRNNAGFFNNCFKQTVQLAMELGLASLGHVSLDGSKFKASSSKHKAMSHQRLVEKEKELMEEIDILIQKANVCDEDEDREYKEKTGYELPEDLKFKEERLARIQVAREALEKREEELNPGKPIDGKKQISFADTDSRIMGKNGAFNYQYNGQISVDEDNQVIVEPVFGQIKNTGFRGFSVRGKTKTSGEFSLVCAVHNIKKTPKPFSGEWYVLNLVNWYQ